MTISHPFAEDDLLPLSALQHLVFCERQCALIHIENAWAENALTLEGRHMHGRVDDGAPRRERRGDLIIARGVPLRSLELGLSGRADVVEFHRSDADIKGAPARGVALDGVTGSWVPFPVDYKHGKPKADRCDEVQLCAQAICLEEMLAAAVPAGALFYGRLQRRHEVVFDASLREETRAASTRLHTLIRAGVTPRATKEPKCERCSLHSVCLPEAMGARRSAAKYVASAVAEAPAQKGDEG